VSETTGHGQPGHNNKKHVPVEEEQQQPSTGAIASLVELGIDPTIAEQLTATHPAERIVAVVRRSPSPPDPQPCRLGPHRTRSSLGPGQRLRRRRATAGNPTAPARTCPSRRDTVSTTVDRHPRRGPR
jgi:hypothetical protein